MSLDLQAAPPNTDKVIARIKEDLAGTPYEAASLRPLSGGNANFIFHVILAEPLEDGTTDVVVKHGEAFVATAPGFQIPTARCKIEETCLRYLADLPPCESERWVVKTPKLFHFDPVANNQIQEFQPNAMSLKNYALKHYAAPTPASLEPQCIELGRDLGGWLKGFHAWANHKNQAKVRDLVSQNKVLQDVKHMINYRALASLVERFPNTLGECNGIFDEISQETAKETLDDASLSVIHGDFWTGNILIPDKTIDISSQTNVQVVDWEMTQLNLLPLDVGQMIAELYELKLFKDIDAGLWMIRGFVAGYGSVDEAFAYRALVHVGAHLICIGVGAPGWGTPKQVEEVVRVGRDILLSAWKKDRRFFDGHDLECLFG